MSRLRRLALFAAGTDLAVLQQVPIEEDSQSQLGSAVWLAASLAAIGSTVGASLWAQGQIVLRWQYLLTGLIVGAVVFSIDRLLVRMPLNPIRFPEEIVAALHSPVPEERFDAALAALSRPSRVSRARQLRSVLPPFLIRFALSFCMSFVIANFLMFVLFAPEVKQRVAYMTAKTTQELVGQVNTTYDLREQRLRGRIVSLQSGADNGVAGARTSLGKLQSRLSDLNGDLATLQAAYLAETRGTKRVFTLSTGARIFTSNLPGRGKTAASIAATIADTRAARATVIGEIAAQQHTLASTQASAARSRSTTASQVAGLRAQLRALEAQRESALGEVSSASPVGSGILVQYDALSALEHDANPQTGKLDPAPACHSLGCRALRLAWPATPLGAWVISFRVFLLLVDMLPILLKLHFSLRARRPYDALRAAYEEISLAETYELVHRELLASRLRIAARAAGTPAPEAA